jgi:sugar phosphate isomerase/epimerase
MRLGISLDIGSDDPDEIAHAYVSNGYGAAVCPPVTLNQPERMRAIREAFARHEVLLAEVGVWNNMLDTDLQRRNANIQVNIDRLALAEELGARCCVNIAGSFHPTVWDGPHPNNLSDEAYEITVENARRVIDAVRPQRAYYCLETMPWVIPDSPDSYIKLIEAVDRPMFGVHLDPVNMINCPARFYDNAGFLQECFSKLGKWIISCHGKDIVLADRLTVHLDEARPGAGALDYRVYLQELNRLPSDTPLILEHLPRQEYALARDYVLQIARDEGLAFQSPKGVQ